MKHPARRVPRRVEVRESASRRLYLSTCAALDTPPRDTHMTPRSARRVMRRHLALTGATT